MKIDLIAGARPNFMKIAPLIKSIKNLQSMGSNISYRLVHTGQHYDRNMSDSFFEELNIPEPDVNLNAGGGTQAEQTGKIMVEYERLLMKESVDLCLVVGDVTSTMACSIVAKKMNVKVAHVEAGIRSGDMTMPEEVNRIVTDSLTDYFFTTTQLASDNLFKNGVKKEQVFLVGNTMIDTLLENKDRFRKPDFWDEFGLQPKKYLVLTLHRPSNVDSEENLEEIVRIIENNTQDYKLVFPVHPRTQKNLERINFDKSKIIIVPPMSYLQFNYIVMHCVGVITDSGGVTEETTVLGIPCITLRNSTERPETCTIGTNELIGTNPHALIPVLKKIFNNDWKKGEIPALWDGNTANRICQHLLSLN